MNYQPESDLERQLRDLEAEVNKTNFNTNARYTETKPHFEPEHNLQGGVVWLERVRNWFDKLPQYGKVAVVAIAIVFGFSLLKTVLQLVISLITVLIVTLVLYTLYKRGIIPNSKNH